jgi:hypothetical protein
MNFGLTCDSQKDGPSSVHSVVIKLFLSSPTVFPFLVCTDRRPRLSMRACVHGYVLNHLRMNLRDLTMFVLRPVHERFNATSCTTWIWVSIYCTEQNVCVGKIFLSYLGSKSWYGRGNFIKATPTNFVICEFEIDCCFCKRVVGLSVTVHV